MTLVCRGCLGWSETLDQRETKAHRVFRDQRQDPHTAYPPHTLFHAKLGQQCCATTHMRCNSYHSRIKLDAVVLVSFRGPKGSKVQQARRVKLAQRVRRDRKAPLEMREMSDHKDFLVHQAHLALQ